MAGFAPCRAMNHNHVHGPHWVLRNRRSMSASKQTNADTPERLDAVGGTYTRGSRQDRAIRELIVRTFAPHLTGPVRALQLGYSEGIDTELLLPLVDSLDVVEGSRAFHEDLAARALPKVRPILSLFEAFEPPEGGRAVRRGVCRVRAGACGGPGGRAGHGASRAQTRRPALCRGAQRPRVVAPTGGAHGPSGRRSRADPARS